MKEGKGTTRGVVPVMLMVVEVPWSEWGFRENEETRQVDPASIVTERVVDVAVVEGRGTCVRVRE